MSKNRELDILASLFNKLSEEEKQELLDLAEKDKSITKTKQDNNKFYEMDLPEENPKYRKVSKTLNRNSKKIEKPSRKPIRMIDVECRNCGKIYNLPENYPNISNFICCV